MLPEASKNMTPAAVVINDDPRLLDLQADLLRKQGIDVRPFADAGDALSAMVGRRPPDLIVTGLYAPGLDGWRFCRLLRSSEYEAFNQVPILVVSATFSGEEADRITADIGANGFLPLPLDDMRFAAVSRSLISGQTAKDRPWTLIVEDSPTLAGILKKSFQQQGYQAAVAPSLAAALNALKGQAYDLAVIDYHLPDGRGDTLLARIRGTRPDMVCIMMTTDPSPELALAWMRQGAAAYLRKPFEPDYLMELCSRARRERTLLNVQDLLETRTEQLRQSQTRLEKTLKEQQLLLDGIETQIWYLTDPRTYGRVNRGHAEFLGRDPLAIAGKKIEDILPPETAAVLKSGNAEVFDSARPVYTEAWIADARGERRRIGIAKIPKLNENGRTESVVCTGTDITERKQADDQIRRYAQRLKAVVDILQYRGESLQDFLDHALDQAIALTTSRIGYIYFYDENKQRFILNSWSKEVMKACRVVDPQTCYELDRTGIWGEAVRQRKPIVVNDFQADNPLKKGCPEGHVPLTRFLTVPVFHNDQIVAVVGVANKAEPYEQTDVLELTLLMDAVWKSVETLKSQQALREREHYLHTIIQTSADGFWVIDNEGRVEEVNQAYCKLSGYERREILGMTITDLDADETPAQTAARIQRIIRGGSEVFETRHRRKDGSILPVEVSAAYIREFGGKFICFCRDLTERNQREERIAVLGRMLDAAPAAITIHDTGGRFHFANEAAYAMHGYEDEAAFLAVNLRDLDVPESEALLAERFRNIAAHGEARFEVAHFRRDGSSFPLEVLAKAIHWNGQPAVLSVATDISERRRADQEREKLHEQLAQSQKMESVGRLAGGVAHDFNNMLGVILGFAELALEQAAGRQPLHTYLGEIQHAAQRSADLTRQLLAFARKQTIEPAVLDLNKTVQSMIKMLRRLIGEHIELSLIAGEALWPVKMDPSQVDQILANLCVNARDAISGIGRITIETANVILDETYISDHAACDPGDYVRLSVTDNGCGMDRETLSKLFEPFFTTKELGKGTGLGLATVYGVVKQNKGFVNAYSEPGRGTEIRVYLPRHIHGAQAEPESKLSEPAAQGCETILLVEDEPVMLKMARLLLERQGYTVLAAASPAEALRLAGDRDAKIDLLVTDVIMPGMNGRDLAQNLLAHRPHLKRLYMSGYSYNVIARHGVLDEDVHFIHKPFTRNSLCTAVRRALDSPARN